MKEFFACLVIVLVAIVVFLLVFVVPFKVRAQNSPDNTRVPPATNITVPVTTSSVWTLGTPDKGTPGNFYIMRNGVGVGGARGSKLVLCNSEVYTLGRDKLYWKSTGGAGWVNTKLATLPCDPVVPPPTAWIPCANEGAQCSFSGTKEVRYGISPIWVVMTHTGGVMCSNDVFGDPLPGKGKACSYRDVIVDGLKRFKVSWIPDDTGGSKPATYNIYRDGVRVGSVNAPTLSYQDQKPTASGATACYEVTGVAAGEGPKLKAVCAKAP